MSNNIYQFRFLSDSYQPNLPVGVDRFNTQTWQELGVCNELINVALKPTQLSHGMLELRLCNELDVGISV